MSGGERSPSDRRGQTTVDFAAGMGLFVLVAAFVVTFVPGIFAPFDGASDVGSADRVAESLGTDRLGDPGTPYVLNATCTRGLFDQLRDDAFAAPEGCRFDTTVHDPARLFGLPATDLNVTVERLRGGVVTSDGTTLAAGPATPSTGSVTTARRVVLLGGTQYRLVVRVW